MIWGVSLFWEAPVLWKHVKTCYLWRPRISEENASSYQFFVCTWGVFWNEHPHASMSGARSGLTETRISSNHDSQKPRTNVYTSNNKWQELAKNQPKKLPLQHHHYQWSIPTAKSSSSHNRSTTANPIASARRFAWPIMQWCRICGSSPAISSEESLVERSDASSNLCHLTFPSVAPLEAGIKVSIVGFWLITYNWHGNLVQICANSDSAHNKTELQKSDTRIWIVLAKSTDWFRNDWFGPWNCGHHLHD